MCHLLREKLGRVNIQLSAVFQETQAVFIAVTLVNQHSESEPNSIKVNRRLFGWLQGANEIPCTEDILLVLQA